MDGKYLPNDGQKEERNSLSLTKDGLSKLYPDAPERIPDFLLYQILTKPVLKRPEMLKRASLIDSVFAEGDKLKEHPLSIRFLCTDLPANVPVQLAIAVSRRNFKRAVDRNRIKRLIREAWRLQKLPVYMELIEREKQIAMVILYQGRELPEYHTIEEKLKELLNRFRK